MTPTHVWLFDINRRVYEKAPAGRLWASSGPVYREHWERYEIVGETRVSWLTKTGRKVPKKGGYGIAFSEAEVDNDVWLHDHGWRIADKIRYLKDASKLRAVADIIGYK